MRFVKIRYFLIASVILSSFYGYIRSKKDTSVSYNIPNPIRVVKEDILLSSLGKMSEISIGSKDAPVTIVEYTSMTCFHCADFHNGVFNKIEEKYIKTGKVRYIFRSFPIDNISIVATILARCAEIRSKGGYVGLLSLMFKNHEDFLKSKNLNETLFHISKLAGFSKNEFDACKKNQEILNDVIKVKKIATDKFLVDSTPSFFIGGKLYVGSMSESVFFKIIDSML
ncbi:DsbA family protein [Candidatus Liberibacter americanus]|uniref:Protein-disulfide isomerase n=1 Tax=Candidatus Liberibacter americanus str. Sao Paulo TaxID=1261131 RepID=U6B6W4_9HYPH|nr:thioredoxin domain-containing protein [Candidatus Liberibacter americanus]AHA27487.1 Protein-disulfide isomerase [Candidatus Liberibacter americanus str. Sao Paulo]EMS36551.1 DSBA oxidoreductase [Candidatus Liberibacter americanus PW_SP]